jgi:hypothetical protein
MDDCRVAHLENCRDLKEHLKNRRHRPPALPGPRHRSGIEFFMGFRGPKAHSNRVEKPPAREGGIKRTGGIDRRRYQGCAFSFAKEGVAWGAKFFMKFRGRDAHPTGREAYRT